MILNNSQKLIAGVLALVLVAGMTSSAFAQKEKPEFPQANNVPFQEVLDKIEAMRVEILNSIADSLAQILASIANARADILASVAEVKDDTTAIRNTVNSPIYGNEEIKNEVRYIENNVTSPEFGLEEIHDDVHDLDQEINDEHDDRESEHEDIQTAVDDLGQTGIKMYRVYADMRFNYWEPTPSCGAGFCYLLPDVGDPVVFGISATCPDSDPNCGTLTFTSVKNLKGYKIITSKDATIDMGAARTGDPVVGTFVDKNFHVVTAGPVPVVGVIGLENNMLFQHGTGPLYGQEVLLVDPTSYFGVAEFTVYAPVGTTFDRVWYGCGSDQFLDCSRHSSNAPTTAPSKTTLDAEDMDG